MQRAAQARAARMAEKLSLEATIKVQKVYRGYIVRKKLFAKFRADWDKKFENADFPSVALSLIRGLCLFFRERDDASRLNSLFTTLARWFREHNLRFEESQITRLLLIAISIELFPATLQCVSFLTQVENSAHSLFSKLLDAGFAKSLYTVLATSNAQQHVYENGLIITLLRQIMNVSYSHFITEFFFQDLEGSLCVSSILQLAVPHIMWGSFFQSLRELFATLTLTSLQYMQLSINLFLFLNISNLSLLCRDSLAVYMQVLGRTLSILPGYVFESKKDTESEDEEIVTIDDHFLRFR